MNVIDALEWRYATKKFDAEKILPVEKLDLLKKAFNLTATSYGLQPLRLLIISDKALQKQLKKHSWDQNQVAEASHILVFCIETTIDKEYIVNYFKRVQEIRNTPDEILDPFKNFLVEDFENKPASEISLWATRQAYLAMGNLITVCAVEGIDACPMEGFIAEKYDEILDLNNKNLKSVLVMPIGYRAEDDDFASFKKVRRELSDSVLEI